MKWSNKEYTTTLTIWPSRYTIRNWNSCTKVIWIPKIYMTIVRGRKIPTNSKLRQKVMLLTTITVFYWYISNSKYLYTDWINSSRKKTTQFICVVVQPVLFSRNDVYVGELSLTLSVTVNESVVVDVAQQAARWTVGPLLQWCRW